MKYFKNELKWQEHFINEYLELEEKLPTLGVENLAKTKIRLSFENHILNWDKYEQWACEELGCSSFKKDIPYSSLGQLVIESKKMLDTYSNYNLWNEDLVPLMLWNNHLVVLGLEYPVTLNDVENHIFILAPVDVLDHFKENFYSANEHSEEGSTSSDHEKSVSQTVSKIEGLDFNLNAPVELDFTNVTFIPTSHADKNSAIWDFLNERHEEYCFETLKHFDQYLVLKIKEETTEVFKSSPNVDIKKFNFNLKEATPFMQVLKTGQSLAVGISQLYVADPNLKYACITPIKKEKEIVGFLLGLKSKNLSASDQELLEELALESAA